MSTSSSRNASQRQAKEQIGWLAPFLERTFFGPCPVHKNEEKNDLNRYCINCDVSACTYCVASDYHDEHKLLKLYRYVYQEVVPLAEMETLIDCTEIQCYRSNKRKIISLHPLPHSGSGKAHKDASCQFCERKLFEPAKYRFCSIACKLNATRRKRKGVPCRAPFF